jgi:hypothetical protein
MDDCGLFGDPSGSEHETPFRLAVRRVNVGAA